MTFTYAGTLSTDLDKVRFHTGDITSGSGVRPSGANFTDEELGGLITAEGSWQRAVAAVYEALAAQYAPLVNISIGPRSESLGQAASAYAKLAAEWRNKYGRSAGSASTQALTRVDGYSDDIAADSI